jgi:CDP-4-dehydro-6-deoxyglucose reductase
VLVAAQRANVALPHDCTLGGCGTCRMKILEGSVRYLDWPLALTPEEADEGYALACQAQAESDLLIAPAQSTPALSPALRHTAIVESVQALSPLVTHLCLAVPEVDAIAYCPGQYLNIIMPDGSTRSFSMASKPNGSRLDLHVRRLQDGAFTDLALRRLRRGDTLEIELPAGSFRYADADARPLLMLATGTGLAPIKAILEGLMENPDCPPVSLYWGGRTRTDLYLHDEIVTWRDRLYDFRYVPVLSRADAAWDGRRGYVQNAVLSDFGDLTKFAIYLCGSPEMISAAKQRFIAHGASLDHIYSEGFVQRRAEAMLSAAS